MVIMVYVGSIIVGFSLLVLSAHFVVYSSSQLARKMNISSVFIGMTIVAFGTSMPELVVNVIASMQKNQEVVFGNIIGSNIINILVILGISSLIRPISVFHDTVLFWEVILCVVLAFISLIIFNDVILDRLDMYVLSRSESLLLLVFFGFFLTYHIIYSKNAPNNEEALSDDNEYSSKHFFFGSSYMLLIILFVSLFALFIGGKVSMYGVIGIAELFNMSQRVIGITIVAMGTSLPELVVSIMAIIKKNSGIALGNIVGSNAFNILFIFGVSGLITPISLNSTVNYDLLFHLGATVMLSCAVFFGKRGVLTRFKGSLFLIVYGVYIFYVFK